MQSVGAGIVPNKGSDVSLSSTNAAALPDSEIESVCIGSVSTRDADGFSLRNLRTVAIIFGKNQ